MASFSALPSPQMVTLSVALFLVARLIASRNTMMRFSWETREFQKSFKGWPGENERTGQSSAEATASSMALETRVIFLLTPYSWSFLAK